MPRLRAGLGAAALCLACGDRTAIGLNRTLQIDSGNQQQGAPGAQLPTPLAVRVLSASGIGVPGITVTWRIVTGGGTLNPTASVTNDQGVATSRWTLGTTVGQQRVTASVTATLTIDFVATATAPAGSLQLRLQPVVSGLQSPLYLTSPPGDARLFVVEQVGRVRIVENGQLLAAPFLDIRSRVSFGGERGLLGLAFHPQYATNGLFFVNFTDPNGDTRVERFEVSSDRNVANAQSASLVLGIEQPFANHNGGHLLFAPDGTLFIGMGDGGSGGDPLGNGQNMLRMLGKMLRIDVSSPPYVVPPSNPFVGRTDVLPEIWGSGLRNPWRYAVDRATDLLYVADVGQSGSGAREEVSVVPLQPGGVNFGWNIMEGRRCYTNPNCNQAGLTLPVIDYDHSSGNCSVIGGYVYRGTQLSEVVGHYFYSDLCGGWLRSFRFAGGAAADQRDWGISSVGQVYSFGEDATGELYMVAGNGGVYKIVRQS